MADMTQVRLQSLVHYAPRSGTFTRLTTTGNASKQGDTLTGTTVLDGKAYQLHRLAFIYMTGRAPSFVKHIDGDKSNNVWGNLAPGLKSRKS